jgi:hypothetical protein
LFISEKVQLASVRLSLSYPSDHNLAFCLALDSLLTSLALLAVMIILPFPLDNLSRKTSKILALVLPSDPRDIKWYNAPSYSIRHALPILILLNDSGLIIKH